MFIKWRVYQRQKYHKKGDKFFLQPVLVKAVRPSKRQFRKFAAAKGISEQEFKKHWEKNHKELNRPRHFQLFRFPPFPSCAYVHYYDPGFIEQRKHYWEFLEGIFKYQHLLSSIPEHEKNKILEEIESILPKPTGELLTILEEAYTNGMPRDPSPKEYFERTTNVVPHELRLQFRNNGELTG